MAASRKKEETTLTGQELYTALYDAGIKRHGSTFSTMVQRWDETNQETKDMYNDVANIISSTATAGPIQIDDWISSFSEQQRQEIYEKLYTSGCRIYKS